MIIMMHRDRRGERLLSPSYYFYLALELMKVIGQKKSNNLLRISSGSWDKTNIKMYLEPEGDSTRSVISSMILSFHGKGEAIVTNASVVMNEMPTE